ncbi:hypothetical protein REC12_20495 [Desulfosporosinus sp. PR]|uniref:hypothetical protein n=1 Tax=Candidatus Desulfosporosinus nitrosoreducens TaxID=3401928 RepID=UPI0027F100A5|nr:hypothetical protein [Desulfosporosinus sp. PR]MDQ7095978.1 hypothetical protein [Desulfosporosinus sp. PR]
MVIKQASQTCDCGLSMEFPEAEIKTKCLCGAAWILGPEGHWYTSGPSAKPVKTKKNHYERYMARRKLKKRKKRRR